MHRVSALASRRRVQQPGANAGIDPGFVQPHGIVAERARDRAESGTAFPMRDGERASGTGCAFENQACHE